MALVRGMATNSNKWTELYWLNPGNVDIHEPQPVAVRRKKSDDQWYITKGIAPKEEILQGPYPTFDTVAMLLEMGAVEL